MIDKGFILQGLPGVTIMKSLISGYLHFHHCAAPLYALLQRPPSTSSGVADKKMKAEKSSMNKAVVAQCGQGPSDSQ